MMDFDLAVKALEPYFKIKVFSVTMHLHCLKCDEGWSLQHHRKSALHPGNVLGLLNHAYSHKGNKKDVR